VVRAADWYASDPGLNPRQGRPLYIWMYTPAPWAFLGWICALYKSHHLIFELHDYGSMEMSLRSLCSGGRKGGGGREKSEEIRQKILDWSLWVMYSSSCWSPGYSWSAALVMKSVVLLQGSYRPWKSLNVLGFWTAFFKALNVLEMWTEWLWVLECPWKLWLKHWVYVIL
jgi:hypothetical protein